MIDRVREQALLLQRVVRVLGRYSLQSVRRVRIFRRLSLIRTFFEVAAMSLSEARFHDLVDETQEKLEDIFDESDLDIDMENSAGVLTVKFENGSQLIFSRQEPLRQLWLAAVSGGFHFDYDEESERWMCDKSEEQLGEMLERIVKQQAGADFDFEGL
jgi:CyaY protein